MFAQFGKCTKHHWIVYVCGCTLWNVNHLYTSIKPLKNCELIKANKRKKAVCDIVKNTLKTTLTINITFSCFFVFVNLGL